MGGVNSVNAKTDVTDTYLTNADLKSLSGWTIDKGFGGNGYTDWKSDGDVPVIEFYHTWGANAGSEIGSAKTFNFSQTATLPAGYYRLAVNAFYREGNGNGTNTKAYIYAGTENTQYVVGLSSAGVGSYTGSNDLYKAANAFSLGNFSNEFDFQVTEAGEVEIGFHGYIDTYCSWCILGPVTLYEYTAADYIEDYDAKYTTANGLLSSLMNADVKSALQTAMVDRSTLTTVDEVKSAINTLGTAITNAQSSINAYASANVSAYLTKMKGILDNTNVYTTDTYNKWYANVQSNYDNGLYTDGEVVTLTENGAYSTGWHSSNHIDDVLLSTWSIDDVPCGDYTLPLYINTWSVEGNTDGSEFYNPFFEYWVASGSLEAKTFVSTMTGLKANTTYSFTIRARVQGTSEKVENAITLKVGDGTAVDISSGTKFGTTDYYIGNFSAVGETDAAGKLTTTITVVGNSNISWLSFYNCKVTEGEDLSAYIADYEFALSTATGYLSKGMDPKLYSTFSAAVTAATLADANSATKQELLDATAALNAAMNSEVTQSVADLEGSSDTNWTKTGSYTFHKNTWSTDVASDGSGMAVPFLEYWRNGSENAPLDNSSIKYSLTGETTGYYKVTAQVRSIRENQNLTPAGVFFFANDAVERAYIGTALSNHGVYADEVTVYGYVGDDGKLDIGFKLINTNCNWIAWKNVKIEYVGTTLTQAIANNLTEEARTFENATTCDAATAQTNAVNALSTLSDANYTAAGKAIEAAYNAIDRDFSALAAAIVAAEAHTLGFEAGEYAPYVLAAPLAAAKAIDQESEANTQSEINTATTNLNNVAANTEAVNAVYNGDFALSTNDGAPAGWSLTGATGTGDSNNTIGGQYRPRAFVLTSEAGDYAKLASFGQGDGTRSAFYFRFDSRTAKDAVYTYGEAEGYTMPLKTGMIYKLTAQVGGWGKALDIKVAVVNSSNENLVAQALTLENIDGGGSVSDYEMYFVVPAVGNYKLQLTNASEGSDNAAVISNIVLKSTEALTFADGAVPTYVPGTYPTVKITRNLTAGKWATAVYPFAVSGVDNIAVLNSYDASTGALGFTSAAASTANVPFLMRSTAGATEISLNNVEVAAAAATDATASEASLKGTYAATTVEAGEGVYNYVLSSNKIYKVGANAATIDPYRAYIQLAQPTAARALSFFIDGEVTTGIEGVAVEDTMNSQVFNLNGQRVESPRKGLYIKNGQKVVVK